MATNIEHADILDLRELADLATEQGSILEDEDSDDGEKEDAQETLKALASLLSDIGYSADESDADDVSSELQRIGDGYEPTLIAEDHFEKYCEELCSDLGYLPDELPSFISSNIDWSGVADDLKVDYNEVELDGETYFIRSF